MERGSQCTPANWSQIDVKHDCSVSSLSHSNFFPSFLFFPCFFFCFFAVVEFYFPALRTVFLLLFHCFPSSLLSLPLTSQPRRPILIHTSPHTSRSPPTQRQPKQLSPDVLELIVAACDGWKRDGGVKLSFICVSGCERVGKLAPRLSLTST